MNRRIARTLLAAGAGASAYLAASAAGRHRPAASSLLVLGCVVAAGNVLAKASSAHLRIDALVPQVATAASAASSAQTTANNAMPKSGGTFTGNVAINGNLDMTNGNINNINQMSGNGGANIDIAGSSGLGILAGSLVMNGGDITTIGAMHCTTAFINGFQLTMNHGDPTEPGGAPLSYSPAYCTSVRDYAAGIVTGLSNSGVFA